MGGILASILDTDQVTPPERADQVTPPNRANFKVKNKKNAKAATTARAAGAKTPAEIGLESIIAEQDKLSQKQSENTKATTQRNNLNTVMDKIGDMAPARIFSEDGFNSAKSLLPSLERETYFNSLAPSSVKRKKLTSQLSNMPIGTVLPPDTLKVLANEGIVSPNKYMRMGATPQAQGQADPTSLISTFESAFVDNPLAEGAVGRREQAETDREARLAEVKEITKGDTKEVLSKKQRADLIRTQKASLDKDLSDGFALQKTWETIQDFSNPKKAFSTVRIDGGDVVRVDAEHSFQNMRDIGLLFTFIKSLDPRSTVRESEIELVGTALSKMEELGISAERIIQGKVLTDAQRDAILSASNSAFLTGTSAVKTTLDDSRSFADEFGLKSDLIIGEKAQRLLDVRTKLSDELDVVQEGSTANGAVAPTSGTTGSGNKFRVIPD